MRYIILAAGKGGASFERSEQIPKCLVKINSLTTIDRAIVFSKNNNIKEIYLVGGFKILKIMSKYPQLQYYYNSQWASSGNLKSLLIALETLKDDLIITYSDVIYDKSFLKRTKSINNISMQYDSRWANRYEARDHSLAEILYDKNGQELGEFTGALFIPKSLIQSVNDVIQEIIKTDINASLLQLAQIILKNFIVEFVDVTGSWAELDSIQDADRFIFGTKSETLNILKKVVSKSKILGQFTFRISDYENNQDEVISHIQKLFVNEQLVVRSSALNEDTHKASMAGNYISQLKVPLNDKSAIKNAINSVVASYLKSGQIQNPKNQVLVQRYLNEVSLSGVVLTKDLQTDSPYFSINYSEGSNTEAVTSGAGSALKVFICYRNFSEKIKNRKIERLIEAIRELEIITNYDAIDVEFAFVGEQLYILQVRPIAAKKDSIKVSETDIDNEINSIKQYINSAKYFPDLFGKSIAYGVMPDWNPAEIIGINPKQLAYDLYKYLITDNVWPKSRSLLGYKDVGSNSGLVLFAGRPYVDIRMSFSSFIPKNIKDSVANKLVDAFISELKTYPENHDKVEFKTVLTAFDFDFDFKLSKLSPHEFSKAEKNYISKSYKDLTQNIVLENSIKIEKELSYSLIMANKRVEILDSNLSPFDKVFHLLEDCKKYGTLPFSNLARMSFVGLILIESLHDKNLIEKSVINNFLNSVHSIATDFSIDCNFLLSKQLSKEDFLKKYGHLRPGTYEITSKTYNENYKSYINVSSKKTNHISEIDYQFSEKNLNIITKQIIQSGFDFSAVTLLNFTKKAIEAREKSKFEFTKNLSAVLDLIGSIGFEYLISKDDLSYLSLEDILRNKKSSSRIDFRASSNTSIANNKKKYIISSAIKLPDLIFSNKDVEMFYFSEARPTFVTFNTIFEDVVFLDKGNNESLYNKIVMIESADPGFDWIFTHNIKGLITKYGGIASHMAIRCAEFDLPAAIGCGNIFNDLIGCSKIEINCANQKITGFR